MKVKIIVLGTNKKQNAIIKKGKIAELPSLHDGWNFDFQKQLKKLKDAEGFILVREDTPSVVEGCMIFQLLDKEVPFMAYLEIAPHNRGAYKRHDNVAGCLIAHAFRLSLMNGKKDYKGLLYFKIGEEKDENRFKLMTVYQKKYKALQVEGSDYMVIADEDGMDLIKKYLS